MPLKVLVLLALSAGVIGLSSLFTRPDSPAEALFHRQVTDVISELTHFRASLDKKESPVVLKEHFVRTRLAYKRASVFADYFFPTLRRSINGPDLAYAEEDNPDIILDPHGFQVVERMLFDGTATAPYTAISKEIDMLATLFTGINEQPGLAYKFRDALLFDALKAADIRLISLGITGFDSPLSLNSLAESAAVLEGMEQVLSLYGSTAPANMATAARAILLSAKNFNAFDRLRFISEYADPLYGSLVKTAGMKGFLLPDDRTPINRNSTSIFSNDFLDINFFSPNSRYQLTSERVALGRLLFYDSILSLSRNRSCATCHQPSLSFTDGLKTPGGTSDSVILKRNTPTLARAAFQTRFFYDSRTATLENQLNSVVHNADEMNGSLDEGIRRIRNNGSYFPMFKKAYPNDNEPVTQYSIANAISSYVRSLAAGNSKFDMVMRGEGRLSKKEKAGFNLFAGKAKCATCHYLPLFNGLVPPQFTETESEVLGVPARNDKGVLVPDDDLGKFLFTRSAVNRQAFKTPTLRNIRLTAPYMHNGVYASLEEVMDFYNKGGGAGLHQAPPNQTLPPDELHLSKKEIKNIIFFLATLTDIQPNESPK